MNYSGWINQFSGKYRQVTALTVPIAPGLEQFDKGYTEK
jgi:hypothetical protein